jgi:hypothetical protein
MKIIRAVIGLFLSLSSMIAIGNESYTGNISLKFYDMKGSCIGTMLDTGKVITNHHCVLNEDGNISKELYFQLKKKMGGFYSIKLSPPEYVKMFDVNNVDNLTRDHILLTPEKDIPFSISKAPSVGCSDNLHKLYTKASKDNYCIVKSWSSGIYTSRDCVFDRGYSGTPLYQDLEKSKICGIYTLTIKNNNKKTGLGVVIKIKENNNE